MSGVSSDRAREQEARDNSVDIAILEYNQKVINYERALDDRRRCFDSVEVRNNAITNWLQLFDFLRTQGFADFASQLESDFLSKENNRFRDVEIDCIDFPEPTLPVPPEILIEEGFIHE